VLSVRIRNPARAFVDRKLLRSVSRAVARQEGLNGRLALSIHLVDDAGIRDVNRQFRGVDAATDVLSFPLLQQLQPGSAEFTLPPDLPAELGDVLISVERASAQAQEFGHSVKRELCYLLVHGLLHLLGYDHVEESERLEMRRREEAVLAPLGLSR
jgi:probable rRNA maturation factor